MSAEPRILKTEAEQQLADSYGALRDRLPGHAAATLRRDAAIATFERAGLPHRRVEAWKYTDLRALMGEALPLANTAAAPAKVKTDFDTLKGCRLVFVDGAFEPKQSDMRALEPAWSSRRWRKRWPTAIRFWALIWARSLRPRTRRLLSTPLSWATALYLHIAADTKVAEPIILVFAGTQAASCSPVR